jgi:hypothetical protein
MFSLATDSNILKRSIIGAVLCLILCSFAFITPSVFAQQNTTLAELQAQIAALMAQIAKLQGNNTTTVSADGMFAVGTLVQPNTTNLRVRTEPHIVTGSIIGMVNTSDRGVVLEGPVKQGSTNWYKVEFKAFGAGWVSGAWLAKTAGGAIDVQSFITTTQGELNAMEPGLADASIAKITVAPASFDRYVNRTVLEFTPATSNGEDLPWVAFENISLWSKGWKVLSVNAGDMSKWQKMGDGYRIVVFTGNQKISPNRSYTLDVAVSSDEDTPVGDRWTVRVPKNGVTIWSQGNGHMTNVNPMTAYPIEFSTSAGNTDVSITDVSTSAIANRSSVNSEYGTFIIEFEITAGDKDIYLPGVPNGLDYAGRPFSDDSFVNFRLFTGTGTAVDGYNLQGYSSTLTTTADDLGTFAGYINNKPVRTHVYLVEEGETEEFTLTVTYKPEAGMKFNAYSVGLEGPLRYSFDKAFHDGNDKEVGFKESDFRTKSIVLVGGTATTNKATIRSFTATPSVIPPGGQTPVTFTWKSVGTSYCYIVSSVNGVENNTGISDLPSEGTRTYYVPDKYENGTIIPYTLKCQDAGTLKDKLVQATAKVTLKTGVAFVTITNITSGSMPTISGNSEERVSKVGFSIGGPSGDKVYGSGDIATVNGKWSHKVTASLPEGVNEVIVYVDNKEVSRKKFTVNTTSQPAELGFYEMTTSAGSKSSTKNISKADALANCKLNAGMNPKLGTRCTWNGVEIYSAKGEVTASSTVGSSAAPGKNAFACNRSVLSKQANGTVACYGMWDYGNDFGGDVSMCGAYAEGKTGCVIATPVCTSGAAKATKYISNASLMSAQLETVSTRLKVSPDVAKSGIAGLWEYTCSAPVATGVVLGASTDVYSEMIKVLRSLSELLQTVK